MYHYVDVNLNIIIYIIAIDITKDISLLNSILLWYSFIIKAHSILIDEEQQDKLFDLNVAS